MHKIIEKIKISPVTIFLFLMILFLIFLEGFYKTKINSNIETYTIVSFVHYFLLDMLVLSSMTDLIKSAFNKKDKMYKKMFFRLFVIVFLLIPLIGVADLKLGEAKIENNKNIEK